MYQVPSPRHATYDLPLRAGSDASSGADAYPVRGSIQVCLQPVAAADDCCACVKEDRPVGRRAEVEVRSDQRVQRLEEDGGGRAYFVVAPDTTVTKVVTGLAWQHEIAAQVFEEAAVDLSRALAAYLQAKAGSPNGRHVGFPRLKRKGRCRESFRLRNRHTYGPTSSIRVGEGHPRCGTLPTIGKIRVHDDTRRLRRLLRPVVQLDTPSGQPVVMPRAKILFATVRRHGARW